MGETVRHPLLLSVLDGIHRGAIAELTGPICRIGSGPMCDVLISDVDVAEEHFVLRVDRKMVSIEAAGGSVLLGSGTRISAGARVKVALPVRFEAGNVQLGLAWASDAKVEPAGLTRFRGAWICAAAAFVATSALALHVNGAVGEPDRIPPRGAQPPNAVSSKRGPDIDVAAVLRGHLREVGIDGLAVSADGAQVNVKGELPAAHMSDWLDTQKWFDGRFGASYVLSSQVDSSPERPEPRFNFQAVWFGDRPYAIGSDGTRLYVGAALEGGWIIADIRDGRLTVRRDNENFVLTF
ncbi:hypothetical protein IB262_33175 [Ensifer sp. ENS02]|uniref:SctD/MshK family protein n=1 Tax=Ensifer sp. ENS02 TaxID=2769290 RepID=UPI00177C1E4C|nr:FHA domain-containing protein [Ensifer sp. ENS02]MBD9524730.1 hypothetical protein [Ensifer sp. ENS02]